MVDVKKRWDDYYNERDCVRIEKKLSLESRTMDYLKTLIDSEYGTSDERPIVDSNNIKSQNIENLEQDIRVLSQMGKEYRKFLELRDTLMEEVMIEGESLKVPKEIDKVRKLLEGFSVKLPEDLSTWKKKGITIPYTKVKY
ncbi:hypothetical protein RI065_02140 [Mycoplasmatota bacterium zrk1]